MIIFLQYFRLDRILGTEPYRNDHDLGDIT